MAAKKKKPNVRGAYTPSLKIRFKGTVKKETVYITTNVNCGYKDGDSYSPISIATGLTVQKGCWSSDGQKITGEQSHMNVKLTAIKDAIKYAYAEFSAKGIVQPEKELFRQNIIKLIDLQRGYEVVDYKRMITDAYIKDIIFNTEKNLRGESVVKPQNEITPDDYVYVKSWETTAGEQIATELKPQIDEAVENSITGFSFKSLAKAKNLYLTDYIRLKINYWEKNKIKKTVQKYEQVEKSLLDFQKEKLRGNKIDLYELTRLDDNTILIQYINWLKFRPVYKWVDGKKVASPMALNTFSKYKTILGQFIITEARKSDKLPVRIDLDDTEFKKKTEVSTKQVSCSMKMLKDLYKFDVGSELEVEKDQYIIGSLTGGLRISDLKRIENLQATTINNEKVYYLDFVTEKTKERVKIPIHHIAAKIFAKYDYKMPPMNNDFNEKIKEIGKLIGWNEQVDLSRTNITTNTVIKDSKPFYDLLSAGSCRKNFATIGKNVLNIPTTLLMQITGHRKESSFFTYIRNSAEEAFNVLHNAYQQDTEW